MGIGFMSCIQRNLYIYIDYLSILKFFIKILDSLENSSMGFFHSAI